MKKPKIWKKRYDGVNTITDSHLERLGISDKNTLLLWIKMGRDDEYLLPGTEAFTRLLYKHKNCPIRIWGDYDADGILATFILEQTLAWLGFTDVGRRIPKRCSEGYGMNMAMVDELPEEHCLIITVDNGIAAPEVVAYAKAKGHTVVVTDHHEPVKTEDSVIIPKADLVIDPKAYPGLMQFDGYCGAGIAYKLARHLLKGIKGRHLALLPLAALATVCDQMPIREENYYFLKTGLQVMNRYGQTDLIPKGLRAMGDVMGITVWDEGKFGFQTGPMINSAERMNDGGADSVVALLENDDLYQCRVQAEELKKTNQARKEAVASAVEGLSEETEKRADGSVVFPLVKYLPGCSEGIIGIIAGKMQEKLGVPVGVFTDAEETGLYKGSFRSTDGFDIMDLLNKHRSMFEACGGHAAAAGVSVRREQFDSMVEKLHDSASGTRLAEKENLYDAEIDNRDIEPAIAENEFFAPFGQGNEDPVVKVVGFCVESKRSLKSNGIKLHSQHSDAIGFNLPFDISEIPEGAVITIYGHISMNVYNGKSTPQIMIIDIEM